MDWMYFKKILNTNIGDDSSNAYPRWINTHRLHWKKKKFELTYPEYQQRVRLDCSIGHSYRLVLIAMQFELHQPPNLP